MEPPSDFHIHWKELGKKFYQRWLFKDLDFDSRSGRQLALVGRNGSGKSTLLRIIAGQMAPSQGRVSFQLGNLLIPANLRYQYLSWSGPYIEVYPDLNLREHINLHFRFKSPLLDSPEALIQLLKLESHQQKPLRFYSSGMLQRVKVGMALFSQSELLLLDEPTSNMDQHHAAYMLELIQNHLGNRILILASNLAREFDLFSHQISLDR